MKKTVKSSIEMERRFLPNFCNKDWKDHTNWTTHLNIIQVYPRRLSSLGKISIIKKIKDTSGNIEYILEHKTKIDSMRTKKVKGSLSKERFDKNLNNSGFMSLLKHRFNFAWDEDELKSLGIKEAVIDIFVNVNKQPVEDLVIIEIEFRSVKDYLAFSPPDWFGEEITHLPFWSNYNMCKQGLPIR